VAADQRRLTADILVAGAGPAGLALALQAHDDGAVVRVVDRRPEAVRPSRALILHARTLEVLRPLGVTPALLARADTAPAADLRLGARVVRVRFGGLALRDTAFPHLTLVRQMDVERVLAEALTGRGVEVERGTELAAVHNEPGGVRAVLRNPTGAGETRFGFAVGCDGPASTVRAQAGLRWTGRVYPVEVVLADAELDADLPGDAAQVVAGRGGLLFAFRLGEQATWRLLATRPATPGRLEPGSFGPPVSAVDLQALMARAGLDARITDLRWSARVMVQRRLASRFRRGRLFLAGEAAHAFSPATGQGMNAAIQDAANLGWKLAFAAARNRSPGDERLLDSYDRERRPVARQLLALTNLAFWAEAGAGPVPSALRARVAPLAAPLVPALTRGRPAASGIRLLSQLSAGYRGSPLSVEATPRRPGGLRAGDRLPARLGDLAPGRFVTVHRLTSVPGRGVTVVRPDGYIGFLGRTAEATQLVAWLARVSAGGLCRRERRWPPRPRPPRRAGVRPVPWVRSAASIARTMSLPGIRSSASASRIASSRPNPCELAVRVAPASGRSSSNRCTRPGRGGSARTASTTTASAAPVQASISRVGSPSVSTSSTSGGTRPRRLATTASPAPSSRRYSLPTPITTTTRPTLRTARGRDLWH
jgi:2-polyprenyl-6-methoxyphenol hydroxylase-like FAD-dependent oxidoreductase